jgi:sugar phosphate isomerase/epimerase
MNHSVITRNKFVKTTGLALASTAFPLFHLESSLKKEGLRIGLCGTVENSLLAKQAGCLYLEEGVAKILMPDKPDAEFNEQFKSISTAKTLPIECFNLFLPAGLKTVGNEVNLDGILSYASVAFRRAELTGAKIIVFGSGGSRRIPDGFDHDKAKAQFISVCQSLAPLAAKHDITLAVEQLNKEETNFIHTMRESSDIVEAVGHPHFKMICDIYHALKENDPADEIIRCKNHLVHCHLAEKNGRTPPDINGDDFTPYLSALKKINYKGRVSLECRWKNMETELAPAVNLIQQQYESA